MPLVSVIMPCFNHGRFVEESVRSILRQSWGDFELIIVDDCSSDNSWELINKLSKADPRIRPIRHERNLGASKSRNDGLRVAAGQFIGFCDADDIWCAEKLKIQIDSLRRNPLYNVSYCDAVIIDETSQPTGELFSYHFPPPRQTCGYLFNDLAERNFINMQSVLMRRECLLNEGFFDGEIKWVEDWWYWVRLARHHQFLYMREPYAQYRVHSRSTNLVQKRGCCINRFKVFRRILNEYSDLPSSVRANIFYHMAVALNELGKKRTARRLLFKCLKLSVTERKAFKNIPRTLVRMVMNTLRLGCAYK